MKVKYLITELQKQDPESKVKITKAPIRIEITKTTEAWVEWFTVFGIVAVGLFIILCIIYTFINLSK